MENKEAPPPSYADTSAPPQYGVNPGYAPPQGDTGAPQGYSYPPQQTNSYQTQYNTGYGVPTTNYSYAQGSQSSVVVQQPVMGAGGVVVNQVPDHMGLAIFATICCCWPLGIVAIMRASDARRHLDRGDFAGAAAISAEAKRYSLWAIMFGFLVIVGVIIGTTVAVINAQNQINAIYNN